MTKRYLKLKLAGRCVCCAAGLQDADGLFCVECADRRRRWAASDAGKASARGSNRKYAKTPAGAEKRRRIAAALRARRIAAKQCVACCAAVVGAVRCPACAAKHRERARRSRSRRELKQREECAP